MSDGFDDLLSYSIAGEKGKSKNDARVLLEEVVDDFFWGLNDNKAWNENAYGGEIEKGFHPSQICNEVCARKLLYEYEDVVFDKSKKDIEPGLRRIFENGTSVHDRWQRYFTQMSIIDERVDFIGSWKCKGCGYVHSEDCEVSYRTLIPKDSNGNSEVQKCPKCGSKRWKYNEFRLRKKDLRITGKRDGKLVILGENYLLEIKSINTFKFSKLFTALPEHKKQFSIYMFLDGTKKGFFIYEDKNTQAVKIFYHEYNPDDIATELAIVRLTNLHIDNKTLPKRFDSTMEDRRCKECAYKKSCKTDFSPYKDLP